MKPLGVVVNTLGTSSCDTVFVCVLLEQLKFQTMLKQVKQDVFVFGNLYVWILNSD
jgi:hypothetical protein